jgi:lysyl-tRNA synthetase class 2
MKNEKHPSFIEASPIEMLRARHTLLKSIRAFFYEKGYLEVDTPYLSHTAPADPYIEPLSVLVDHRGPYYLHTSPEVAMKKLLAKGADKIFQICKVFRVEEFEEVHNVEFTMVEWYRPGTYEDTMTEVEELVCCTAAGLERESRHNSSTPWKRFYVKDLFVEYVGFDPLVLSCEDLLAEMGRCGFKGLHGDLSWEDLFFIALIQKIEPAMETKRLNPYFIIDWPASITAMAKKKDPYTVERFELYMEGLEIANGYSELVSSIEQRSRIAEDNGKRQKCGKTVFEPDETFLHALDQISGPVSGVSVGIDRLLMALCGKSKISEVLLDRFTV